MQARFLQLGSTAIGVFGRYAQALEANGGRLFLAEVSDSVRDQLEKTGTLETFGADSILPAGDRVLASQRQAYATAEAWLAEPVEAQQGGNEDADS